MGREAGPTERSGRLFGSCWRTVLFGFLLCLLTLLLLLASRSFGVFTLSVSVIASVTMIGVGLRRYAPPQPLPWYLLSISAVQFTIGTVLRDVTHWQTHPFDDLFTLTGYCGIGAAAVLWLRPRKRSTDHDLLLDSALIGLGALLASWTFLISPILHAAERISFTTLTAATYPVVDALMLTVVAHSVVTSARSEYSLRLVHLAMLIILAGDLGYNLETAGSAVIEHEILLVPLQLAYTLIGVAALHPTMVTLGEPRRILSHRSRQRASIIAIVLIVASLVPVVGSSLDPVDRLVVSSLFALLLAGMLLRSERAIERSARSERRAQYQADHDMLTGLLNRAALLRALHRNRERWGEAPLALLFIDLDGFKRVNDNYGHAVGDELIANAAARIRRIIRRDDAAARYGGDEFVVLTPVGRQQATLLAERLLAALGEPFELSAAEVRIAASIGVACSGGRGSDTTVYDLLREADSAMYQAKEFSLGYVFQDEAPPVQPADPPAWQRETAV
ncbi:GGDEF domain-containing protein [Nocardia otitidiscaviarum]|uniref:GGDEF domain-containing protein n=1 Tax=Nocardia otitidiscaviarum TaxID=1823 RepID=UPI001F26ECE0|nr:GGDEF domain-containing protein [Nocardia otitidiscaviarum]